MPIRIGGHVIRNIPEQVGKNKKDIKSDSERITLLEEKVNEAIAGVFHYKGSVATYSDLPATGNEVGDTYNVLDTGNNFTWDGTGWDQLSGLVDLSAYYTKAETDTLLSTKANTNTENTFSMLQKMAAGLQVNASSLSGDYRVVCANNQDLSFVYYDNGISTTPLKLYANGDAEVEGKLIAKYFVNPDNGNNIVEFIGNDIRPYGSIIPYYASNSSLGSASRTFANAFIDKINPNTSGYGLTSPDTTSFTADKEIATTDSINDIKNTMSFKKIAYADYQALSSNEQQALLDVGCQIIGTLNVGVGGGNVINPVLFPRRNYNAYSQGIFISGSSNQAPTVGTWEQIHGASNLTIKVLFRGVDEKLTVQRLSNLNGASFPQYPSDASTKTYIPKLVNGSWLFVEDI